VSYLNLLATDFLDYLATYLFIFISPGWIA
jgi:hypothetical protein